MKKWRALITVFALFAVACGSGQDSQGEGDEANAKIGDTGPGGGIIFFAEGGQYKECSGELGAYNWAAAITTAHNFKGGGFTDWHLPDRSELNLMYENLHKKGKGEFSKSEYWSSTEYSDNAKYAVALSFEKGSWSVLDKNGAYKIRAVRSYTVDTTPKATLTINNQSFTEIADVIWNNVSFANNQYEKSIKSGTTVTKTVQAGAGYIFFKRKTSPITARTRDLVVLEKDQQVEFVFRDNTIVVEINNPNNNGALSTVQSTVIWWDDAEGEMQPYTLKQSFVGYYATVSDLLAPIGTANTINFYPPKNGNKSIAIGGTNTALLQLKINLERSAKLSFWYANKRYNTAGTTFSINGVVKATWNTDVDWSFLTFDLEPGENDLKWEKKDGYYSSGNTHFYYLSLDDILIYYTE